MQKLVSQVDRIAATSEPVLILGETGSGKGVLAKRLHTSSARRSQRFLELNCAALPEALIESELFGHTRGAFTGATEAKRGLLETVDKGTLFLDEIGEMPLALQAKLLHVLESGRFMPVGATQHLESDFRLVAASNKNLMKEKDNGGFRADLFFRIGVFLLEVPPLRERLDEIPDLCTLFLSEIGPDLKFSNQAIEHLLCHSWPGNVRELRNVVRHSALLNENSVVGLEDLPEWMLNRCQHPETLRNGNLKDKLDCFQACILRRCLEESNGDLDAVLRNLGISRSSFYRKLHEADQAASES